jgi:hypothetical protein
MPYKDMNDRDPSHEAQVEKKNPKAVAARKKRQQARQLYDKLDIPRKGKDIDHIKGTEAGNAKSNLRLQTPSQNRSFPRNSNHTAKRK